MAKEFWNKGYANEIAKAQIDFIKHNFKNASIFATVHPKNIASQKILLKQGMHCVKMAKISRGERLIFSLVKLN